jgi:hypothetical protein
LRIFKKTKKTEIAWRGTTTRPHRKTMAMASQQTHWLLGESVTISLLHKLILFQSNSNSLANHLGIYIILAKQEN